MTSAPFQSNYALQRVAWRAVIAPLPDPPAIAILQQWALAFETEVAHRNEIEKAL